MSCWSEKMDWARDSLWQRGSLITDLKWFIFGSFLSDWVFMAWNSIYLVNKKHFLGLWRMHAATTEKTNIIRTVLISGFLPYPKFQKNNVVKGSLPDLYSDVDKWTDFLFGHLSFENIHQKVNEFLMIWNYIVAIKTLFIFQSLKEFIKAVPGTTIFDKLLNCPCSSHSPSLNLRDS